jgi:GNAT superfamily N-acetyltransferase
MASGHKTFVEENECSELERRPPGAKNSKSDITISPMRADECESWEPLWTAYLEFYETALPKEMSDVTWKRLHDPAEPMFVLGAYLEGRLVGIVHYLFHRSCWSVGNYCYLQDLFVAKEARGRGVGRALIEAVEHLARKAGASRIYWLTKEDNFVARALYDQVADRSGFIQYRKLF